MATKEKSSELSSTRQRRPPNARMIQNFHLVWLDESIDEGNNDDCRNSITNLRQVVNTVNTFTDVDECIDFITDIKDGMAFMIVSRALSQSIVPLVQTISQVNSVYIFCENEVRYEKWAKEWTKMKGDYIDITSICEALKQTVRQCDQNLVPISFIKTTDGALSENLDQLDSSFMYTQILKEILLTIDFERQHINDFLTYCREQFAGNIIELGNMEKLGKEYRQHQPIWWYTYLCSLYSMLNRALRLMEVDRIIKMGFFVRDLHNHIAELHSQQYRGHQQSDSFIVYRGQGLSQTDFDQLRETKGGLMSFNNFLSTSVDRAVSLLFAKSNQSNPDLIGVLFEITIDPSIPSSPFANVGSVSHYGEEKEILFSMHSVFRIGQIKEIDGNDRLWQVDLTLTGDKDPQLQALTKSMQKKTPRSTGWFRLGQLMLTLGQFNKAQELYEMLLEQASNEFEKGELFQQLGQTKCGQGEYAEATTYYEKSIKILQRTLPANHSDWAPSYNNIGLVYNYMGEYARALSYYEKALEIDQKNLPANHPDLAISYNNIGGVYKNMGEYSKALSYYKKALEIRETLPTYHPDLAISYNNIGGVYDNMGEYSKALSYYEKDLAICQKTLPANHPDLATSYNNIGLVYNNTGEYSKALSYYEKDLVIQQNTLPINHIYLASSYNNIGEVHGNMGEHSKALSYHAKALEIRQKALPAYHPDLAHSYNNIGGVYNSMGEYSKALSYYEKALGIRETLPAYHPDLSISFNNIGEAYRSMGEFSKALSYYENAVKIQQKTLPANHPHLAISYHNIGSVYYNMSEYSKSLSYMERALNIFQRSLPVNHPNIKTVTESIQVTKKKL